MRISTLAICTALAVAVVSVAPAAAETDTFSAKGTLSLKGTDAQGRQRYSGPLTSPGFGRGVATNLATINPDGTTTADLSVKFEFGTLKAKTTGTVVTDAAGNATFTGTGKITGGTRAYKDGKGTFKYSGKSLAAGRITYNVNGKVQFPTR